MSDLITLRDRPPRARRGDNWGDQLRIGLLIDWLESRSVHAHDDVVALNRRARRNDLVALAAAGLTGRLDRELHAGELAFTGHNDHALEYGVAYHARIAGHLDADEMAIGEDVYRRLVDVAPGCVSGLVNLAEIERRRGESQRARTLLESALARAHASVERRYGVADRSWITSIQCALALGARAVGEGQALLDAASMDRLEQLVAILRGYGSWERAALSAHQAFSVATGEQRIALHSAMRLAPIHPQPPPSAHDQAHAPTIVYDLDP